MSESAHSEAILESVALAVQAQVVLSAAEIRPLKACYLPFCLGLPSCYVHGNGTDNASIPTKYRNVEADAVRNVFAARDQVARAMTGFTNVDFRTGSALHAAQVCIMALTKPREEVLFTPVEHGGHSSYHSMIDLLGRTPVPDFDRAPTNYRVQLIGHSETLLPHVRPPSNRSEIVLLDTAQVSGFTFAGHQASVKDDPGIVVLGSTHKTLPLMPTGYILSNDSSVFKKVQEAIFPTLIRSYNTLSQLGVACGLHDWQRRAFGYLKRIEALQRIMNRELQKAGVKSQQIRSGQNHQMWILAADKADSAVERLRQANILLDARDFPGVGRGLRLGLQTLALDDVETTTVALLAQCIGRALRDAPVEFDQRTYRCGPCRD